jgi:hypothetical protein
MKNSLMIIHWAPRILCILAILFIGLFALDVFDEKYTFWQTIFALFMHLIPNFILIILLIIAWKWELAGGMILAGIALVLSPPVFFMNFRMNHSVGMSLFVVFTINFPFILAGGLFILSSFAKRKQALSDSAPKPDETT